MPNAVGLFITCSFFRFNLPTITLQSFDGHHLPTMTDRPGSKGNNAGQSKVKATPAGTHRLELEYPQIPLHLSLESLLVHSSSSSGLSSHPAMPTLEPNPPALGDSWASLTDIGSSNEEDLRSEHTDVGSLLDVPSSDDVHSVMEEADGEAFTDEEGVVSTEHPWAQHPLEAPVQQHPNSGHLATSVSEVDPVGAESQETIRTRRHTIVRPLTDPENRQIRHWRNEDISHNYCSVIYIPLLEEGLNLDAVHYFKVILLGRHVGQFRPEIQRKLGDALVSRKISPSSASPTSVSRFHVIPSSFGPGSEPEFADLVAIDNQIDFECYDLAEPIVPFDTLASLVLRSSQTHSTLTSEWDGGKFAVTNGRWISPDLAIICVHLDGDNNLSTDSLAMIEFAERHCIPRILIRMDRGWQGDYEKAVHPNGVHESIRTDRATTTGEVVTPKIPVDIPAFLNLDSALLNKHIAFLNSKSATPDSADDLYVVSLTGSTHPKQSNYMMAMPLVSRSYPNHVLTTLCIIVGVYICLGAQLWWSLSNKSIGTTTTVDMPNGGLTARHSDTQHLSQNRVSGRASEAFGDGARKLALAKSLSRSPAANSVPPLEDNDLHFQVGIIDERQLMVKLSREALGHEKRSELKVVLTKANRTIPAIVQELFDGIFSVQLQPRDTYGDIEVNLTMTEPRLSQTLTIYLGSRVKNGRKPLKAALDAINGTLQDAIGIIPSYLPRWPSDISLPALGRRSESLGEDLKNRIKKMWMSHPISQCSTLPGFSKFWIEGWTVAEGFYRDQGKKMLRRLTDDMTTAQAALFKLAKFSGADTARISVDAKTSLLAKKLSAAQGRARLIVSNAAGKLRSRKAGG